MMLIIGNFYLILNLANLNLNITVKLFIINLYYGLNMFKDAFYIYSTSMYSNLLLIDDTSINNKYSSENVVVWS